MKHQFLKWMENKAQQLRRKVHLKPLDPLDPYALAPIMDISVISAHEVCALSSSCRNHLLTKGSREWSAGTITLSPKNHLVILNPNHLDTRKRASLMEEISHIFLKHKPSSLFVLNSNVAMRSYKKSQESQAYGVGAAALIPADLLYHASEKKMPKSELADYCRVSLDLVNFRSKITRIPLQE